MYKTIKLKQEGANEPEARKDTTNTRLCVVQGRCTKLQTCFFCFRWVRDGLFLPGDERDGAFSGSASSPGILFMLGKDTPLLEVDCDTFDLLLLRFSLPAGEPGVRVDARASVAARVLSCDGAAALMSGRSIPERILAGRGSLVTCGGEEERTDSSWLCFGTIADGD